MVRRSVNAPSKVKQFESVPQLSFPDAILDGFDKFVIGAKKGDSKEATVLVSHDAANEDLRGQEVSVNIEMLDVLRVTIPETR